MSWLRKLLKKMAATLATPGEHHLLRAPQRGEPPYTVQLRERMRKQRSPKG